jgi:hypothetical protein
MSEPLPRPSNPVAPANDASRYATTSRSRTDSPDATTVAPPTARHTPSPTDSPLNESSSSTVRHEHHEYQHHYAQQYKTHKPTCIRKLCARNARFTKPLVDLPPLDRRNRIPLLLNLLPRHHPTAEVPTAERSSSRLSGRPSPATVIALRDRLNRFRLFRVHRETSTSNSLPPTGVASCAPSVR